MAEDPIFVGVHIGSSEKLFTLASLDRRRSSINIIKGTSDEILAYLDRQGRIILGFDAPTQPNQGLMALPGVRKGLYPAPVPGRWTNMRQVDYELRQMGVRVHRTPAESEKGPSWMRQGFRFITACEKLGFIRHSGGDSPRQYLEVNAEAAYRIWLNQDTFACGSLEGRLQRQFILEDQGLPVPDGMIFFEEVTRYKLMAGKLPLENVMEPGELFALAAAQVAWLAVQQPEKVRRIGEKIEGEVYLPVWNLRS